MKKGIISFISAAFVILSANMAQAALVRQSDVYATDTINDLDWLNTSYTMGLSYDNIVANPSYDWFGDGSLWRVATVDETLAMFESALGRPLVLDDRSEQNDGLEIILEDAIGRTFEYTAYRPPGLTEIVYHFNSLRIRTSTLNPDDINGLTRLLVGVADYTINVDNPDQLNQEYINSGVSYDTWREVPINSIAIVRDSGTPDLPEPAPFALLGLGLLGIGAMRRKHR